jgi:large subunit ribosomal protein L2
MTTILSKPTSPGRRFTVSVKTEGLHKGKPYAPLTEKKTKTGGRNNSGKITTRHIGGGHKQKYRIIDFKRNKHDVPGKIETLEYDPNRSAHIMLVLYKDGERRYIIAPNKLKVGDEILSGNNVPIKIGNCMPLSKIPLGTSIHCIEMKPKKRRSNRKNCWIIRAINCKRWALCIDKITFRSNEKNSTRMRSYNW